MSEQQDAFIVREAIIQTQNNIEAELMSLCVVLTRYGFVLNSCDVTLDLDRTYGGDVHYRFDARIGIEAQRWRPTLPPSTTAP